MLGRVTDLFRWMGSEGRKIGGSSVAVMSEKAASYVCLPGAWLDFAALPSPRVARTEAGRIERNRGDLRAAADRKNADLVNRAMHFRS